MWIPSSHHKTSREHWHTMLIIDAFYIDITNERIFIDMFVYVVDYLSYYVDCICVTDLSDICCCCCQPLDIFCFLFNLDFLLLSARWWPLISLLLLSFSLILLSLFCSFLNQSSHDMTLIRQQLTHRENREISIESKLHWQLSQFI